MDSDADSLLTLQHGSSKRPIYMDVKMNELSLWRSVLAQAFRDYISYDPRVTSFKKYQEYKEVKKWFNLGSKDFRTVCLYAGYDPQFVYEKFLAAKEKNFKCQRWLIHVA